MIYIICIIYIVCIIYIYNKIMCNYVCIYLYIPLFASISLRLLFLLETLSLDILSPDSLFSWKLFLVPALCLNAPFPWPPILLTSFSDVCTFSWSGLPSCITKSQALQVVSRSRALKDLIHAQANVKLCSVFKTCRLAQHVSGAQMLLCTVDAFTGRNFYTLTQIELLETEVFTQRHLCTQALLHTQNSYSQEFLHSKRAAIPMRFATLRKLQQNAAPSKEIGAALQHLEPGLRRHHSKKPGCGHAN